MSKYKLIFLQPTIGAYRYDFYRKLLGLCGAKYSLKIYCSQTDENNVRSVDSLGDNIFLYNSLSHTRILGGKFYWQSISVIKNIIERGDVLVVNGNPRYLSNLFLASYAKIKGAKIIWWGHGWTAGASEINAKIRFFLMRNFDHVFLYTDAEVSKYGAIIRKKTNVSGLNNGVDVKEIRSNAPVFRHNREGYKLCFIGRLEEKSRIDLLLDAVKILSNKGLIPPGFSVEIIGDGSLVQLYKEQASSLKIDHFINWHGAIWDSSISNNILSTCNAFVYPGLVGLSVVHAFALGLPAIIHDNFHMQMPEASVVVDGQNGLLFKYLDPASLAEKINYIFSDRKLLSEMSRAAFNSVTASFNTEDMAKRFFEQL
ncbi:glycosyltransferase family 4 protein [Cobetia marina]|uniref:glycosyltransferase family 4 protein n=1 Tax=Cobetia marina TaxID=28258 RepID=UPI0011449E91|nr:glycosyltransferase family 4 protein [Cobetia marina]GED44017.1 hypothetical protein HHA02_33460 [Cobetia marina]